MTYKLTDDDLDIALDIVGNHLSEGIEPYAIYEHDELGNATEDRLKAVSDRVSKILEAVYASFKAEFYE